MVRPSRRTSQFADGGIAAVRQTRERFLAAAGGAGVAIDVRGDIVTSWNRSVRLGLEPDSVDVPYDDAVPTPRRLLDAAVPVVDRLASQLTDTSASFLLANGDAHIVRRWACRSFLATLDRVSVAPGFSYAEEGVGTNGLGCAAEEKRLFEVRGPEHFRECLQSLVCVATPIVSPTTNVTQGVLNVTCSIDEANAFLRPLLLHAVADIEHRMLESSSLRERLVLDAFLSRSRRTSNGVIAMSTGIVMANPAADVLVTSSDRLLLWKWAREVLATRVEAKRTLDRADGTSIAVSATAIGDASPPIGALLECRVVEPERRRMSPRRDDRLADVIVGRSTAARMLRQAAASAAIDRSHVLVAGPAGAGCTFVARAIIESSESAGGVCLVTSPSGLAACRPLGPSVRSVPEFRAALVRNIDRWSTSDLDELFATVDSWAVRLVATAHDLEGSKDVLRRFPYRVEVPALSRRIEDIPDLTVRLLADLAGEGRRPAVCRDAMDALLHHDWPGNMTELRAVLSVGLAAAGRSDISLFHLPEALRTFDEVDRWTAIERVERQVIMRALNEHDGNKVATAAALGLARSTLYRKLRALQIEVA